MRRNTATNYYLVNNYVVISSLVVTKPVPRENRDLMPSSYLLLLRIDDK